MSEDVINDGVMSDDEVLDYTQSLRRRLIDSLVPSGEMPRDVKEQRILLEAMKDMDRAALSKKKLVSDDKNADADRKTAEVIAKIYSEIGDRNPFLKENGEGKLPELPDTLLEGVKIEEGEMEIGVENIGYQEFVEKHMR